MRTIYKQKKETNPPSREIMGWGMCCLLFLLFCAPLCAAGQGSYTKWHPDYPQFSFYMPEQAGQLSFGIVVGDKSIWLEEAEIKRSSPLGVVEGTSYEISDPILGKGKLTFTVSPLADSEGIILAVEGTQLPPAASLLWSYGGASGVLHAEGKEPAITPEDGVYNVFSVEESAFTLYYGESMKLKVIQGVMPVTSGIRLANERQKESPLIYFHSGKKTDATSLAGLLPLREGEKEYFCIYKQNEKADYNRFMLPGLFRFSE